MTISKTFVVQLSVDVVLVLVLRLIFKLRPNEEGRLRGVRGESGLPGLKRIAQIGRLDVCTPTPWVLSLERLQAFSLAAEPRDLTLPPLCIKPPTRNKTQIGLIKPRLD